MNAARTEDSSWNHDRIAVFIEHFNQNSYCQIQPWLLFSRASKKVRMMINVDTQQLGGTKKNLENEQKGRNSAAQREEERKKSGFNFIGAKLLFKSQLIKWDAWVVLPNFKVVFKLTTVFFFFLKIKDFLHRKWWVQVLLGVNRVKDHLEFCFSRSAVHKWL